MTRSKVKARFTKAARCAVLVLHYDMFQHVFLKCAPKLLQISVNDKENINGKISCKRNAKNPRDLDITIEYDFEGDSGAVKAKHDYRLR